LKNEHQQAIEEQNRKLMFALARVSEIGGFLQSFKKAGQFPA